MATQRVLQFEPCSDQDRPAILALEQASFPPDEAATDDSIKLRLAEAGEFFYKLTDTAGDLLGFINGSCISGPDLEEDSMSSHVAMGPILVIHSVTVKESERRKYRALSMLHRYLALMKQRPELKEIRLLTKPLMMSLYLQAGFKLFGISPIVHGADPWFEMRLQTRTAFQLVVDAFTPMAFKGNPAAVVFEQRNREWMQNVAAENNFAETAFVSPLVQPGHVYALTWFTPTVEVELCGHATLATAAALYHTKRVPKGNRISFVTPSSGTLYADQNDGGIIFLNFPSTPPSEIELSTEELSHLTSALGIAAADIMYTGRSIYDLVVEVDPTVFYNLLTSEKASVVHSGLVPLGGRGVLFTTKSTEQMNGFLSAQGLPSCDFASRCFFPCYGVNEDSVTGSAHCALAPYWGEKLAKSSLTAFQASKRGGVIHLELAAEGRIVVGGDTAVVIQSEIM